MWRKGNYYFAEMNGFFLVRVPDRQLINVYLTQTACLQTQKAEEQRSLGITQKPLLCGNLAPLKQMFKGFILSLCEIFVCLADRDAVFLCFVEEAKEISHAMSAVRDLEGVAHKNGAKVAFLHHFCRCWESGLLQANESSCEIEQPSGIVLIYTTSSQAPYFLCCMQPRLSLNFCSTAHSGNSLFA